MNKLLKLPIFLGVVGCLCGGVLSLTNFITKDKIAQDEYERANAAYYKHFAEFKTKKEVALTDELKAGGVTLKEEIFSDEQQTASLGYIYTCSVVGFAGKSSPINFTLSFADGKINNYVNLGHGESAQGAKFLDWLDKGGSNLTNLDAGKAETGSSVTYGAISKAFSLCNADYLASYNK